MNKNEITNETEKIWRNASVKQKKDLLIAMNCDKSWAKTQTIAEMITRSGGLVARELTNLVKQRQEELTNDF